MKFQKNDWFNMNADGESSVKHGVDVVKDGRMMHVSEGDKPLFFETKKERDEKVKELNGRSGIRAHYHDDSGVARRLKEKYRS